MNGTQLLEVQPVEAGPGLVLVADLARHLETTRQSVYRKAKREGALSEQVPVMTDGGVQMMATVPREWAERLIRLYEAARRNTTK